MGIARVLPPTILDFGASVRRDDETSRLREARAVSQSGRYGSFETHARRSARNAALTPRQTPTESTVNRVIETLRVGESADEDNDEDRIAADRNETARTSSRGSGRESERSGSPARAGPPRRLRRTGEEQREESGREEIKRIGRNGARRSSAR